MGKFVPVGDMEMVMGPQYIVSWQVEKVGTFVIDKGFQRGDFKISDIPRSLEDKSLTICFQHKEKAVVYRIEYKKSKKCGPNDRPVYVLRKKRARQPARHLPQELKLFVSKDIMIKRFSKD